MRCSVCCLLLLASAAAGQPVPDTLWAPADSLIAYGWSTDADGDRVLVGARVWPPPALAQSDPKGVVFVYRRTAEGAWAVEGRLEPDYVGIEDCFSWALDLRGDRAAVGARCEYGPNSDGIGREGAVYVFRFDGENWVREAKLYPSDVAGPWVPQTMTRASFGHSVSLEEGYLVVGAPGVANPNTSGDGASGAAYVFEREGDVWSYAATLVNDDTDSVLHERFGVSVAALGDDVLVGASREGPDANRRGAVYAFRRTDTGWVQQAKLLAPAPEDDEEFGLVIARGAGEAAVGSYEAVYPLERTGAWQVGPRLTPDGFRLSGLARHGSHVLAVDASLSGVGGVLLLEAESGWASTPLPLAPLDLAWTYEMASVSGHSAFIGQPAFDEDGYVLVYDLMQVVSEELPTSEPASLGLTVAPNPASSYVAFRIGTRGASAVRLAIYDVLGREVLRRAEGVRPTGLHRIGVDVSGLAPGTYTVRARAGAAVVVRRFTVVR